MPIEPHAVRYSVGKPVLPPKHAPVLAMPKLSMAEEARFVRARFSKVCNPHADYTAVSGNKLKKVEAEDRKVKLEQAVLAQVKVTGGATRAQLSNRIHATPKRVGQAIFRLSNAGKLTKGERISEGWVWVAA